MAFITPVSMKGTKEQLESLAINLYNMGYVLEKGATLEYEYIVNNVNNTLGAVATLGCWMKDDYNRHCIEEYNPELYLALAAMTDEPQGIAGEYWTCIESTNSHHVGEIYKASKVREYNKLINTPYIETKSRSHGEFPINGATDYSKNFRKTTKEELIQYFSKKEEFVLPEVWAVRPRNMEELLIVCQYFDNRRALAGLDPVNFYVETDYEKPGNRRFECYYANCGKGSEGNVWTYDLSVSKATEITFEQFQQHVLKQSPVKKVTDLKKHDVIHCPTEEEARAICNLMHEAGLKWAGGQSYLQTTYWKDYQKEMCYNVFNGTKCNKTYYQNNGYKIYPASEFLTPQPQKMQNKIIGYNIKPSFKDAEKSIAKALDTTAGTTASGVWLPSLGSVYDNAVRLGVLDVWFEPVYKKTEKKITVGEPSIELTISSSGIFTPSGTSLSVKNIRELIEKLDKINLGDVIPYSVSMRDEVRFIKIGCTNSFSYREIQRVITMYDNM